MPDQSSIDFYLSLPWTFITDKQLENNEPLYVICIAQWPEVCATGPNEAEAMMALTDALEEAIKHALQQGIDIPIPE